MKEKYNKKYKELNLTGNIPQNPHFLYEYELPIDFGKIISLLDFSKEVKEITYDIYLNNQNTLVLSCNITPVVLAYKPKMYCEEIILTPNEILNKDLVTAILMEVGGLLQNNIIPKCIFLSVEAYTSMHKPDRIADYPVHIDGSQKEDFIIGV